MDDLRDAVAELDIEKLRAFRRSLPVGDLLNDRWARAARLGWGEGANVYDGCVILQPVTVGPGTWVGPWTVLDGSGGGLTVGAGCDISAGVHIYTHDTVLRAVSAGALPPREAPVSIGDYTYIGPQATVVAGVGIGSRCVIGAHSFVDVDVPDRSVAFGTPARVVGRVEGEGAETRIVLDR